MWLSVWLVGCSEEENCRSSEVVEIWRLAGCWVSWPELQARPGCSQAQKRAPKKTWRCKGALPLVLLH